MSNNKRSRSVIRKELMSVWEAFLNADVQDDTAGGGIPEHSEEFWSRDDVKTLREICKVSLEMVYHEHGDEMMKELEQWSNTHGRVHQGFRRAFGAAPWDSQWGMKDNQVFKVKKDKEK